jgi:hypothetical protein
MPTWWGEFAGLLGRGRVDVPAGIHKRRRNRAANKRARATRKRNR